MKKLFGRSFVRALIITVVSALIIIGGIYAYETLWSGKAGITIEPTEGEGQLEVTQVSVDKGTWDESSKTWTVSLVRGEYASLNVLLENTGSDIVVIHGEVNGSVTISYPRDGVTVCTGYQPHYDGIGILGGETGSVSFSISVDADAEAGGVPDVQLKVVEGPRS